MNAASPPHADNNGENYPVFRLIFPNEILIAAKYRRWSRMVVGRHGSKVGVTICRRKGPNSSIRDF